MTANTQLVRVDLDDPMLRIAVAAHLARYRGTSRRRVSSDLGSFITWCLEHDLMPLHAKRGHIELYLRWLQETRLLKPATVSRRLSVLATFYRTCVIDGVLEQSRPNTSADQRSPQNHRP